MTISLGEREYIYRKNLPVPVSNICSDVIMNI